MAPKPSSAIEEGTRKDEFDKSGTGKEEEENIPNCPASKIYEDYWTKNVRKFSQWDKTAGRCPAFTKQGQNVESKIFDNCGRKNMFRQ
jgi:hypothetical protein